MQFNTEVTFTIQHTKGDVVQETWRGVIEAKDVSTAKAQAEADILRGRYKREIVSSNASPRDQQSEQ